MCGFLACLWSGKKSQSLTAISAALTRLSHRGPDNQALLHGDGWALGHTRLSIIDTSASANQPFADSSGRYLLAFNGEIYNYLDIRRELAAEGIQFRTSSDTEVLLQLLLHRGVVKALRQVRGMFAFILLDTIDCSLVAARDHFGQKPFHYSFRDGVFSAASEVAALLELSGRAEPDLESWRTYLCSNGIISKDRTFFNQIHTLEAGHILRFSNEKVQIDRYFDVLDLHDPAFMAERDESSLEEVVAELDGLMESSVARHMVSDVPVGITLSGGIDSSLLFEYAVRANRKLTAYTKFSPGIETIPLTVVPELLRLRPASCSFILQERDDYLRRLVEFVAHTATASRWGGGPPMASICRYARRNGVKVLLGGDGVDEYCAGYNSHTKLFDEFDGDMYRMHPPVTLDKNSAFFDDASLGRFLEVRRLEREEALAALENISVDRERFARAVLFQDTGAFLQSCNLPHSDSYSMMESIELRNPFLDIDLVKFVINQPMKYRHGHHGTGQVSKLMFRELASRLLGDSVNVPKEGTRNYSMFISEPKFWNLSKFRLREMFRFPESMSPKVLFRVINLEILFRCVIEKEVGLARELLTDAGKNANRLV